MTTAPDPDREPAGLITRREAVQRVAAMLGGVAFVGGTALLTACERTPAARTAAGGNYQPVGKFTAADVALLDEVADTILPPTKTPGAKAAAVGPFMALMVTDSYKPRDQQLFMAGLRSLDAASRKASGKSFVDAAPQARLALLQGLDREQKAQTDAREAAQKAAAAKVASTGPGAPAPGTDAAAGKKLDAKRADANLPDGRQENAGTADVASGAAVTTDAPAAHYFRMMKELALLGYFTSEIGYTKAMRYVEAPGRFDPCAPYSKGEVAWAPHA